MAVAGDETVKAPADASGYPVTAGSRVVAQLQQLGVLRSPAIADVVEALPAKAFVRPELEAFAHLDIPWPRRGRHLFTPSPRLSVLLAELLEPEKGSLVLVMPAKLRLLARILGDLGATVHTRPRARFYDRALILDGDWQTEDAARLRVANGGFLLRVRIDPHGESLVKYVRDGDRWVRMGLNGLRLTPTRSLRPGHEAKGEPLENLLIVEGIQRRVWDGVTERKEDDYFQQAVDRTWSPDLVLDRASPRDSADRLLLAKKLFHLGYVNQNVGDLANAIELYTASLDTYATAEAHTFRGWIRALTGDLDAAIMECKNAIQIDPDFGNPYNDIGAYLLEMEEPGEALTWLEKAKTAPRYEAPHYAYTNAGRALLIMGDKKKARQELESALALAPDYEPARRILEQLPS